MRSALAGALAALLLAFVGAGALALGLAAAPLGCGRYEVRAGPPEAAEGYACSAGGGPCRGGTSCLDGHCRFPCGSGCPSGYECSGTTADGEIDYCKPFHAPPRVDDSMR
jgi:hypothetical protein